LLGIYSSTGPLIEGFCAKRAYVAFWVDFYFLQDQANFWQTDLFWHEKHCCVIVFVDLHFERHLLERILPRWILTRCKLKQSLLAASTAQFFLKKDVLIFERSREIDRKKN